MELLVVVGLVALLLAPLLFRSSGGRKGTYPPPPQEATSDKKSETASGPRPAARLETFASQTRVLEGKAYVTDGDGLRVRKTEVRLFGIDAPEANHPFGMKAKFALIKLCKGQIVRVEVTGEDAHGRCVGRCYLTDGRDLSAEMVKLGLAIDWPKFSGGAYRTLEVPGVRKKLWLADARQKGRMHVWEQYEARQKARAA